MRAVIRLGMALVVCLVLSLALHALTESGARASLPPAGPAAHRFPPHSARVYRLTSGGDALRMLDPRSLDDRPHGTLRTNLRPSPSQNTTVLPTADGSRFLVVNEFTGRSGPLKPDDVTLQPFDGRTGQPLSGIHHPGVPIGIAGISADGSLAYGFRIPESNMPCPPSDIYLLDTATGSLVRHVRIGASFWSPMLVDPEMRYLYALATHDSIGPCGQQNPWHPILSAYDLRTGGFVHRVTLSSVLAGNWLTHRTVSDSPVAEVWTPGFALSPDGRQIAVLDGHSNTLTLLAAPSLRMEGRESIVRQISGLERLASVVGLAPAIAEAKGQSQGQGLEMQYMPNGRSLLVAGTRFLPDRRRPYGRAVSMGIRLIDIASGRITAQWRGSRRIVGMWPAPDGSAVYSELQGWRKGIGWLAILRRHDPTTLRVLASRTFAHVSWLSLVFLRSR